MSAFIKRNEYHDIHDDDQPENVVTVYKKMNGAQAAEVTDVLFSMDLGDKKTGRESTSRTLMGSQIIKLLEVNVVKWSGPDYDGVPVTPETIGQWDPTNALREKVLAYINKANAKVDRDPKSSMNGTDAPSPDGAEVTVQSLDGTSTLVSQNGTTGRRIKSVN